MDETCKNNINSKVLSDVLLAEYVMKKTENLRFKLDSQWDIPDTFEDNVVLYKLAIVLLALLNVEKHNKKFEQVRIHFEKNIFTDGNVQKLSFYYNVKSAMDKLGELIECRSYNTDNETCPVNSFPWSVAYLREAGIVGIDQATVAKSSVIWMGWAMAWLKEIGIVDTNPARLFQFAMMWIDNYITVTNFLNEYDPI